MAGQPTKIGKYDVVREIGRGGMGKVFAAVDPAIGRMVAIKQVTSVISDDPDLLKRFYREAQSTGKLQHPNIVTLHDLGEQDGVPYLVMEYLEGESLEAIIQERRIYTVAEKLNIIIQVCEGLGYAHHRQIIHRDVKPGNIVVLNGGDVKVVDFGIAQFGNERFTRTGQVIGSLFYMSPEQIQDADIDSRSDIYSTGIVLYEFLTGSVPFRGKDPASTLAKILHDTPPSVASSVDLYATELDEVVRRALAKDRNARYASMEDFAFDLRSVEEKLSQDLIATHLRAAEGSITARQWEKARELLRQVLKLDKQHRRANELLREVQTQIHRQQINEQVRQLRQRADEALGLRRWDEALAVLDQAVKIDSTNVELIQFRDSVYRSNALLTDALRRAESAHNAGDLDTAKSAVEEALNVDPYDTTAKALNAILTKQISERAKRKKIDDLIANARKEIAVRRFPSALEMLRTAEATDPSVTEVQHLIRSATAGLEHEKRRAALEKACGEIEDLLNRDEYAAACDKADDALQRFPQDLGLLKLKGFAEKQREAWDRRQFLEAQVVSARQFADSGELLRAQQILNEALERYPDDAGAISLLGVVTDSIARLEAQRREAERQASEKKRYIQVQLEAAAEFQQNGRTAEALKKIRDGMARYADSEELRQRASVLEDVLAKEEAQRKRADEEARRRKAEIERTIAESWQLLSTKQTGQAVAMLDEAVRRHPDSPDLKSQLEFAQRRLAVARAELERTEQEEKRKTAEAQQRLAAEETTRKKADEDERRRQAWVQAEISVTRQWLDQKQADRAVTSLQQALRQCPENEDLKAHLDLAKRQAAQEQAERDKVEYEAQRKREEISQAIRKASDLLTERKTAEAIESLEMAVIRFPESKEVRAQLDLAKSRFAEESAERQRIAEESRGRRIEIDRALLSARQFMESDAPGHAVTALELAFQRYPDSNELKSELEAARRQRVAGAATAPKIEPKSPREERAELVRGPEKSGDVQRVPQEKASRDAAQTTAQRSVSTEIQSATKFFAPRVTEEKPVVSAPPQPPLRPKPSISSTGILPKGFDKKILNKWTAVAIAAVIAIGVMGRLVFHAKPAQPSTYVVTVDSEPQGANIQIGNQTCVTPNCNLSLPAGEYRLDAQLNGYAPKSQSVVVDPKNPPSPVKLVFVLPPPVETAGYLVVKAGVEGADVLVDGNKTSQTAAGGTLRFALDPGAHTVEVQKKGYSPGKSVTVQIEKGQDTTAEFSLAPLSTVSELVITGATPNVQVLADGKPLGRTDGSGVFAHAIDPGSHELVLMQGDRRSSAIRKTFAAGGRLNVDGERFVFAQPPRPMAIITISHLPNGALVKVEGASYGGDQSGVVRFDVVAGDHKIEISAAGFKPRQIQRSFPAGQQSLDGSLEHSDKSAPNDHDSIMTLVADFEQAYSSKNLAEVCALWPTCPRQTLEEIFKHARSVSQKFEPTGALKMARDSSSATGAYKRTTAIEYKGKEPTTVTGPVTIRFRKQSNFWQIDSME